MSPTALRLDETLPGLVAELVAEPPPPERANVAWAADWPCECELLLLLLFPPLLLVPLELALEPLVAAPVALVRR